MSIPEATLLPPAQIGYILDSSRPVLTHSRSVLAEISLTPHSHPRGQLLWASHGVMKITSEGTVWVVPSSHAVWIPSMVEHQVRAETETEMRNLYIDPSYAVRCEQSSVVMLKMTPLLRELILKLVKHANTLVLDPLARLGLVIIDEIEALEGSEISLPAGDDPRLSHLIHYIINDPTHEASLTELAKMVGASVRTIERLFKAQTGMTYRQWRSRYRLMNSLEYLTQTTSTSRVAYELGYKSVSSFIAAFKEMFGCSPQEYLSKNDYRLPRSLVKPSHP